MLKNKNILVPRNIEDRIQRLRTKTLAMFQNETIFGDVNIEHNFNFSQDEIKTKFIKGDLNLDNEAYYIPEYLKNVKVLGDFICYGNIKYFQNCPYVEGRIYLYNSMLDKINLPTNFIIVNDINFNLKFNNFE